MLLQSVIAGCSIGNEAQIFQKYKMVGCNGDYAKTTFRSACSDGWHVATASDYYAFGGKTVAPDKIRFVDVTWDSAGKETSLDNWQGYYDSSSARAGWQSLSHNSYCLWVSRPTKECYLSFINADYGESYGCHCYDESSVKGVVCVKN